MIWMAYWASDQDNLSLLGTDQRGINNEMKWREKKEKEGKKIHWDMIQYDMHGGTEENKQEGEGNNWDGNDEGQDTTQ